VNSLPKEITCRKCGVARTRTWNLQIPSQELHQLGQHASQPHKCRMTTSQHIIQIYMDQLISAYSDSYKIIVKLYKFDLAICYKAFLHCLLLQQTCSCNNQFTCKGIGFSPLPYINENCTKKQKWLVDKCVPVYLIH